MHGDGRPCCDCHALFLWSISLLADHRMGSQSGAAFAPRWTGLRAGGRRGGQRGAAAMRPTGSGARLYAASAYVLVEKHRTGIRTPVANRARSAREVFSTPAIESQQACTEYMTPACSAIVVCITQSVGRCSCALFLPSRKVTEPCVRYRE